MLMETEIACQIVDKNCSSGNYGIPSMVYNILVHKYGLPKWINRIISTESLARRCSIKN